MKAPLYEWNDLEEIENEITGLTNFIARGEYETKKKRKEDITLLKQYVRDLEASIENGLKYN